MTFCWGGTKRCNLFATRAAKKVNSSVVCTLFICAEAQNLYCTNRVVFRIFWASDPKEWRKRRKEREKGKREKRAEKETKRGENGEKE